MDRRDPTIGGTIITGFTGFHYVVYHGHGAKY